MSSPFLRLAISALAAALASSVALAADGPAPAAGSAFVPIAGMETLPVLSRATDVGPADPNQSLVVALSLPFAKPAEMQQFADDVSNPKSPHYRQFIGPDEVGERFGLPLARVQRVADYLTQHGFTITEIGKNRLAVIARGTVAQAEQAFHTTIRSYTAEPQDVSEPSSFIAASALPRVPADIARDLIDIWGLDTFTRPKPLTTLLTPFLSRVNYGAQPIFNLGMTGAGRTIGVTNFDGFRQASWLLYISHFALPTPAGGAGTNVTVVPVSGGGAGAGAAGGEGDLDIQMELGAAPLATIRIYDSPPSANLIAVLSAEASDNQCDAISESYGWNITNSGATSAHNQHVSMSAEGITYMNASGDSGTTIDPFGYPTCDPEVLAVGGTVANVNSATGVRVTEANWTGGGGGWSTKSVAFNARPSWQMTGTGIPAVNASNNRRLVPDVAFHSSGGSGAYQFYLGSTLTGGAIGTSFASPVFAGHLALVELQVIALGGLVPDVHGHRRFGRIQDLIYSQNNDATIWFDIASGSTNGNLPGGQGASTPHTGWDTCVGWGPMNCNAFAAAVVCATGGCPASPWTNLGSGLAGTSGIPALLGTGTLQPNTAGSLNLTGAFASSPAVMFVSFSSTPVAFQGGTLLAYPPSLALNFATDAGGAIPIPFLWPATVPSGTTLFFQYAISDAGAVHGVSLSNCEKALTP